MRISGDVNPIEMPVELPVELLRTVLLAGQAIKENERQSSELPVNR